MRDFRSVSGTGLAPYHVDFAPSAARSLAKLERSLQRRIARRLDAFVYDPRPRGSEKLRGTAGRYRIRVGDYRIIYDIDVGGGDGQEPEKSSRNRWLDARDRRARRDGMRTSFERPRSPPDLPDEAGTRGPRSRLPVRVVALLLQTALSWPTAAIDTSRTRASATGRGQPEWHPRIGHTFPTICHFCPVDACVSCAPS